MCIILFGFAVYSNTFQVPFVFDDFNVIVDNRRLDNLSTFLGSGLLLSSRWLPHATFAINRSMGGMNVFGFHAVNLTIHLVAGVVVYWLARFTLTTFGGTASRRYAFVPVLASLAFVLHPLQTQSVTYIVQRITSLSSLLYLSTILLYAKAVTGDGTKTGLTRPRNMFLYGVGLFSCLLAMSSKEISFTLPASLALYDICFLKGSVRQRLFRIAPFVLCLAVMFFQLVGIENLRLVQTHGGGDDTSYPIPRLSYLITQLCVIVTYLRLLILPVGQNLDYDYPQFSTLLHPQPALSFILIASIACGGVYFLKRSFDPDCTARLLHRLSGFTIAWFFITISIESGLVPLIDTIFEHRMYLPSVWFFILMGVLFCELYHRTERLKESVVLTVMVLLIMLGSATYRRNLVWGDALTLWTDITEKSPGRARGWTNLGMHYVRKLDPGSAVPYLEHAVKLNPDYYPAHYWLGQALVLRGENDRALDHYIAVTKLAPNYPKGWESAGRILFEKSLVSDTIEYLDKAYKLDPEGFASHGHLQKALSIDMKRSQR